MLWHEMSTVFFCPKCSNKYVVDAGPDASQPFLCMRCKCALEKAVDAAPPTNQFSRDTANSWLPEAPDEVKDAYSFEQTIFADKYVLVKKIGRGGMGSVHKAWDVSLKRFVALKIVLQTENSHFNREENVKRFLREGRTLAQLAHRNILQIHDIGKSGDDYYISTEYVEGGTLGDLWKSRHERDGIWLRPGNPDIRQYLEIMMRTCEGAHFAHSHNIIHRDIKPDNILLAKGEGDDVEPKIADFGLAKEVTDTKMTTTGIVMGTPAFMSPEQATGRKLDHLSDVFTVGAVLYRLCVGSDPFDGENVLDVLNSIELTDPKKPSVENPAIDSDLEIILMKALEKEPGRRYQSAKDIADDLDRYLKGDPIMARPASSVYRMVKKARKHKVVSTGIVTIALGLVAVVIGVMIYSSNQKSKALESLRQADAFFSESKWDNALEFYSRYLAYDKDDPEAMSKKKLCETRMEEERKRLRQEAAKKSLENAALEEIQKAWAEAGMVFTEFYKNDTDMTQVWAKVDSAIARIDKAVAKSPVSIGYFYMGMLNRLRLDLDKAEGNFAKAVELDRNFSLAEYLWGMVKFEQFFEDEIFSESVADPERQKALFEELKAGIAAKLGDAAGRDAASAQFEAYRAIMDTVLNDSGYEAKIAELKTGMEKHRSDAEEFLLWMAIIAARYGAYEDAHGFARKAIERKPQFAKAYAILGSAHYLQAKFGEALADLDSCIRIMPDSAATLTDRAVIKVALKDLDGALADYMKAAEIDKDYSRAYFGMGNVKAKKSDFKGAIEKYTAAIARNPAHAQSFFNRANAKRDLGGAKDALADYDKAIELDPRNNGFYNNRASARLSLGDFKGALEDLSFLISSDPKNPIFYHNRGIVRSDMNDLTGAMEDYEKALELDKNYADAHCGRGTVLEAQGKLAEAKTEYDKAIALNGKVPTYYYNRASARYKAGELDGSISDLDNAIAMSPSDADYHAARASVKAAKQDMKGALKDYEACLALEPGDREWHWRRIGLLTKMRDAEGAEKAFAQYIEKFPGDGRAYYERGQMRYFTGRRKEAWGDFSAAAKADPGLADARFFMGIMKAEEKAFAEAIAEVTEAIRIKPGYFEAHYNRALYWWELKDYDAALADLKVLMDMGPEAEQKRKQYGIEGIIKEVKEAKAKK